MNGLYKAELIHSKRIWESVQAVELATMGWVHWWNTGRLHEGLGHRTPAEVEAFYVDVSDVLHQYLEARFGLDPGFTARLRAANILYDCDTGGGEFFQLYGAATPEGLFLEICQRTGGYDGYGAPNAPFRIAAQKRMLRHSAVPRF
mgnify:CR=1 FL=1